jgi:hypothetical protein
MTRAAAAFVLALLAGPAFAVDPAPLPPPDSPAFCTAIQQFTAGTKLAGTNELFTDMVAYRKSKPFAQPHTTFQVVSYSNGLPIVVSCKVKTAAHLRAVYGAGSVGNQRLCPDVTRRVQAQAVAELRAAGQAEAATRLAAFVVDATEPYSTGQAYLQDFTPAARGDDGKVHLASPGLFQDYDSWYTWILPEQVQGQLYCHTPTVDYLKALATGAMAPGTVVTTVEGATVTPR